MDHSGQRINQTFIALSEAERRMSLGDGGRQSALIVRFNFGGPSPFPHHLNVTAALMRCHDITNVVLAEFETFIGVGAMSNIRKSRQ